VKRLLEIPESFDLHGITYKVLFDNDLTRRSDDIGQAAYRLDKVILQAVIPGAHVQQERQGQVFLHELVHLILHEMHNYKLRDNETFVDLFASLLHQAIVSTKFHVPPEAAA
jgi:predicted SprT family Zn-dependent metalloprotease